MRIEDLCKEKILWEGAPVPEAARKRRKRGGCGAVTEFKSFQDIHTIRTEPGATRSGLRNSLLCRQIRLRRSSF